MSREATEEKAAIAEAFIAILPVIRESLGGAMPYEIDIVRQEHFKKTIEAEYDKMAAENWAKALKRLTPAEPENEEK